MDKTRRLPVAILVGLIAGLIFSFVTRNTKEPEAMMFAPRAEAVEEPATLNVPIMRFTDEEADELLEKFAAETETETKSNLMYLGVFRCTAYCPCYECCEGYALNRPKDENGNDIVYGASGRVLYPYYSVAVDPRVIPYGTHLLIGGHEYVAADCGGGIKGNSIDVYFSTHTETCTWGLRYLDVYLIA